jgi:hypothetical protein
VKTDTQWAAVMIAIGVLLVVLELIHWLRATGRL